MKTRYTPKQKAHIVLEILNEERSIAQITSDCVVHQNKLYKCKDHTLESLTVFLKEDRKGEKALKSDHEYQIKGLYAKIGKLTKQLTRLKKKYGIEPPAE